MSLKSKEMDLKLFGLFRFKSKVSATKDINLFSCASTNIFKNEGILRLHQTCDQKDYLKNFCRSYGALVLMLLLVINKERETIAIFSIKMLLQRFCFCCNKPFLSWRHNSQRQLQIILKMIKFSATTKSETWKEYSISTDIQEICL